MAHKKIKVVVLYGGRSTEHDISRKSAAFVLKNLDKEKYDILAVGVDKAGRWIPQDINIILEAAAEEIPIDTVGRTLENALPIHPTPGHMLEISSGLEQTSEGAELVFFPIFHGTYGEDGAIQGLLTMANAAYVGSGIAGSAIGMDKCLAKKLVAAAGISVVPWLEARQQHFDNFTGEAFSNFTQKVEQKFSYPVFVKPACLGSSVGITKAHNHEEFTEACKLALSVDDKILIEKAMDIREIECAVLGDYDPDVSEPGEVITSEDNFYSYEAKYLNADQATIRVPADLPDKLKHEAKIICKKIFQELNLYGMARVDLFLEKQTNKFYFNEVNTIPGFTQISQYPKLWQHAGKSASQLLDELIKLALKRYKIESKLNRSI
ncbi:MAG: D-alanine--D-alanine ligase family protein [Bdellovibrionota bacterium]